MINLIGKWKAAEMIDFNAEKGTMDWRRRRHDYHVDSLA